MKPSLTSVVNEILLVQCKDDMNPDKCVSGALIGHCHLKVAFSFTTNNFRGQFFGFNINLEVKKLKSNINVVSYFKLFKTHSLKAS